MILDRLRAFFGWRSESEKRDDLARTLGRVTRALYSHVNALGPDPAIAAVPTWKESDVAALMRLAEELDTAPDKCLAKTANMIRARLELLGSTLGRPSGVHQRDLEQLRNFTEHRDDALRRLGQLERLRDDGLAVLPDLIAQLRTFHV